MPRLFDVLGPVGVGLLSVLFLLVLVLAVWVAVLSRRMRQLRQGWSGLLEGADGANVEKLLRDHHHRADTTDKRLATLEGRMDTSEAKMKTAKRYVGLVRFDAFNDVGGQQSFSLAVYDEDGNGAVLTSQIGREQGRVFGKQLFGGKSEVSLSAEEQQAIEAAASAKSRPRIGT
ncbi:MAG: DUF4446 family protein [Fimbriimonadaceae bacterium]|nr:DUF4446 family protein [Fimbriimonadaceae bacterium]